VLTLLLRLYLPLVGIVALGALAAKTLPTRVLRYVGPEPLGRFLYRIGIPISLIGFLHRTELPTVAWILFPIVCGAIALGWGLAWSWLYFRRKPLSWSRERLGSFQLAAAMGNTGYIGYPVCLAVAGSNYFGWAILYDLIATLLGNYGFGVWLANRHGRGQHLNQRQLLGQVLQTPVLWGFVAGMVLRQIPFPLWLDRSSIAAAWTVVGISLLLIGMRLAQLAGWQLFNQLSPAIAIKLILLPAAIGWVLQQVELDPIVKLTIVLQVGMPSAFSTLILAEEYSLDRDASVTAIAASSLLLPLTLPLWLVAWGQF
jgi:hypothetical protein